MDWEKILTKIENAINTVKENPILDATAKTAISFVPTIGPILLQWYENIGISEEDKTEQISLMLKHMQSLSEEKFEKLSTFVEKNYVELIQQNKMIEMLLQKRFDELEKIELETQKVVLGVGVSVLRMEGKLDKFLSNQQNLSEIPGVADEETTSEKSITLSQIRKKGNELLDVGEYTSARAIYDIILEKDECNSSALNNKAYSYFLEKKYSEAEKFYKKSLECEENMYHRSDYAALLMEMGKTEDALSEIDLIIKKQPQEYIPIYNKAVMLNSLGKYEEALKFHNKALMLNENYVSALVGKGVVLDHLNQNEESLNCYAQALKLEPNHVDAINNTGALLAKQGHLEEALKYFIKAHNLDKKHLRTLDNLSLTMYHKGNYLESIAFADEILSMGDYEPAYLNKSASLIDSGHFLEAQSVLDKLLKINPDHYAGLKNKLVCHIKLNQASEAYETIKKLLILNPKDKEIIEIKQQLDKITGTVK